MQNNKRKMMIAYLSLASTLLAGCNSNNNINQNTTEYINEKTTSEITTEIITTEASTQMTEESTTTEIKEELTTTENITETETTEEIIAQETNSSDEQIINEMNNDNADVQGGCGRSCILRICTAFKEACTAPVGGIFHDVCNDELRCDTAYRPHVDRRPDLPAAYNSGCGVSGG